ncbi:MAG: winged helix-turn-helix domain-containing protein [Candidatus Nanohaloarchaeota archaeon QJJ-9]|nr:winged helix-turn-helix domain-containing protein [Candidatus Nanohaloarchaeota archaeon QJJ-9]
MEITLEKIMDPKLAQVLEFLMENPVMDYSKKDLAQETGVSRTTLYRRWPVIEDLGLVKETRKYQRTQLYKLNEESELVNLLGRIRQEIEDKEVLEKKEAVSGEVA